MRKYNKILTKKFLIKEYITNQKSSVQIAKEIECSNSTVSKALKDCNIKTRTLSEAMYIRCSNIKNIPSFKDGRTLKKYFCKDCGKKISIKSGFSGLGRCASCARKGKYNPNYGKISKHYKGIYYKQSYMRSSYEIAFARYCIINHIKYRYEPKAFEIIYKYNNIKKEGTYRPDFYLPETNEYIEIKGYWRDNSKAKFIAFKIQYKNIKIKVLTKLKLQKLHIL